MKGGGGAVIGGGSRGDGGRGHAGGIFFGGGGGDKEEMEHVRRWTTVDGLSCLKPPMPPLHILHISLCVSIGLAVNLILNDSL